MAPSRRRSAGRTRPAGRADHGGAGRRCAAAAAVRGAAPGGGRDRPAPALDLRSSRRICTGRRRLAPGDTDDLLRYCYHVAGAVGLMMAIIMGVDARIAIRSIGPATWAWPFNWPISPAISSPTPRWAGSICPAVAGRSGDRARAIWRCRRIARNWRFGRRGWSTWRGLSRLGPHRCRATAPPVASGRAGRRCDIWRDRRTGGASAARRRGTSGCTSALRASWLLLSAATRARASPRHQRRARVVDAAALTQPAGSRTRPQRPPATAASAPPPAAHTGNRS